MIPMGRSFRGFCWYICWPDLVRDCIDSSRVCTYSPGNTFHVVYLLLPFIVHTDSLFSYNKYLISHELIKFGMGWDAVVVVSQCT